jgi:hypothetical protein
MKYNEMSNEELLAQASIVIARMRMRRECLQTRINNSQSRKLKTLRSIGAAAGATPAFAA